MRILWVLIGFAVAAPAWAHDPAPGDVAALKTSGQSMTFTLITNGGYVRFDAQTDWSVIAMQSQLPVTATAFQLADPADAGTPDSTNLAVSLYDPASSQAADAFAMMGQKLGDQTPALETYNGWTVYTQDAVQGATTYTDMDATSSAADVKVSVRLAWPHLSGHAPNYDAAMRATFLKELDSIHGATGVYQLHSGEALRSPSAQ